MNTPLFLNPVFAKPADGSATTAPKKTTGAEEITWDLSDLYDTMNDPQLKEDKQSVLQEAQEFSRKYHGNVGALDAEGMHEALREYEQILEKVYKIRSFAHLQWATNTENASYGKFLQETTELASELSQQLVFFNVEWLAVSDVKAQEIIESEQLADYKHHLETSRQYKEHTLSEEQEQVMSAKSVTGRNAWTRYFDETLGAARFELDGQELTEQEALSKLHQPNRALRKRAQASLTNKFQELNRTLTFVFNTLLADKATNDKLRKYDHWLEARNLSNEIDDHTVQTLVDTVTDSYPLVQRFYRLKKKLLGYDELYDYDRYAPIMDNETQISWDEAREMVISSYTDFHPRMGEIADKFFENQWIDAAIRPGKRGGAFAASTVPSVHPYVLVNYDGNVRDVQTVAHELGHGVHQYLSRDQGLFEADTPLTTAETASVFGEMLVFQDLMRSLDDPKEQLALLVRKIDDTIATVYRQISMNRFENRMHNARREQGELSSDQFASMWRETQEALYGDSVTLTEEYDIWWSYIPHFLHTPGYVYAYAFGELLVLALYEAYQESEDGFADKYMDMLAAGGSDWPENIVSKVGLDITDSNFWKKGITAVEQMIEKAEQLAESID
ncbi:MAG: M3 family oligoendopeptidase [Bacteroidota bacterium]